MVYVVLGMHKSGTTLVAEMLGGAGVAMGDGMVPGADYDRGHKYERRAIKAINKELLGFAESYRLPEVLPRAEGGLAEAMGAAVAEAERAAGGGDWGFKDPRTVLTWELWRTRLPERRLLLVHRAPQSVWRHYRRFGPRGPLRRIRWWWAVLSAWRGYNQRLASIAAREPEGDWMALGYEALMGPEGTRLLAIMSDFVGRPVPDLRRGDRQRSRADFSLAVWLYDLLTGFGIRRVERRLRGLEARGWPTRAVPADRG